MIIDDNNYTYEEQYYIDTTPEERVADRVAQAERNKEYDHYKLNRSKLFTVNEWGTLPTPQTRQPLWSAPGVCYWAERELCVMAGDTGTGKSLLGLQVARHLAGGLVLGDEENIGKPRHLLYIDFELDPEGFYARFGTDASLHNYVHWASYFNRGVMPEHIKSVGEWLLDTLDRYFIDYRVDVVIIDQPDRLHITPAEWRAMLFKLRKMMQKRNLSVMLIVNTKPRNYARPMELTHVANHRMFSFAADSIVGVGLDYETGLRRYVKPFKTRNRVLRPGAKLPGFEVVTDDSQGEQNEGGFFGKKLSILFTAPREEEWYLKPTKTALKEQKRSLAEMLRSEGYTAGEIADELEMPERIIERWVKHVEVKDVPLPAKPMLEAVQGNEEAEGAEDEFGYNPDLIERERGEGFG